MFFRKTGFLAAMMMTLVMLGGCGADGKVDEARARNWYEEMRGNGSVTNDTDPDGYGLYSGGPVTGDNAGDGMTRSNTNGERNTYGMRTDGGTTLGQDIRNAWDNVKNDFRNMGNDHAGGTTNGNASGRGGSGNAGNAGSGSHGSK